jgi:hypothetical protein
VIVLKDELLGGSFKPDYFCSRLFKADAGATGLHNQSRGACKCSVLYKGATIRALGGPAADGRTFRQRIIVWDMRTSVSWRVFCRPAKTKNYTCSIKSITIDGPRAPLNE